MANSSESGSIGSLLLIATCTVAMLPAAMLAGWLIAQDRAGNSGGVAAGRAIADAEAFADALDRWLTGTLIWIDPVKWQSRTSKSSPSMCWIQDAAGMIGDGGSL